MIPNGKKALKGARSTIGATKRGLKESTRNELWRNNYIGVYNLNLYKITAR